MKIAPKVKLSNAMIEAADAMRDELHRQCELLANMKGGSKKTGELDRLAKLANDYDEHRDNWCTSQIKIAKPAGDLSPEMEARIREAFKKAVDARK